MVLLILPKIVLTVVFTLVNIVLNTVLIVFRTVLMVVLIVLIVVVITDLIAFQMVVTVVLMAFQIVSNIVLIVFRTVLITVDTALMAVDTIVFIADHIALSIVSMASQMDEKKVFIPSHALSQSPVKTPAMKSIRPPRASKMLPTTSATTPATFRNTFPTISSFAAITGAMLVINHSMNGCSVCSHISFTASAILPMSSNPLLIAGCICSSMSGPTFS